MNIVHVLLVDDDRDILNVFSSYMKYANLGVDTAKNGEEALEKLKQYSPEIIIADVQMPGMSGYELCRRVREMGLNEIPFFFCSALTSIPERIKGLRMGADDYITKPVNLDELLLKVQNQLKKNEKLREFKKKAEASVPQSIIEGNIADIAVYEVLQLLDHHANDELQAHFEVPGIKTGDIYVSERRIIHSETSGLTGPKAFYRLLSWNDGHFSVAPRVFLGEHSMDGDLDHWILQGMTHLDECKMLLAKLKSIGQSFFVKYGKDLFQHHLEEKTMRIIMLVENHHSLDLILDNSPFTDLDTIRILSDLYQMNLIAPPEETAT